jgi:hypothetical protein
MLHCDTRGARVYSLLSEPFLQPFFMFRRDGVDAIIAGWLDGQSNDKSGNLINIKSEWLSAMWCQD